MPDANLEFRPFRGEDRQTIIRLLSAGRANYEREKRAIFDWQFLDNPAGDGGSPFLVGTLGGEIVAVNGFMPVRIRFQGHPLSACWSCDTYVDAAYRGHGFGKALIERVSQRAPVMVGFGISDASDPIFARNDWILDDTLATQFFHTEGGSLRGTVKSLCSRAARFRGRGMRGVDPEVRVEEQIAAEELDALWQRAAPQYFSAVERNAAYLIWRYRKHPRLNYRWLGARRGGELRALVIIRHHPAESVIADYAGPADDGDLLADLFDAARCQLAASGTRRVRCETTHPSVRSALARVGFLPARCAGRFRVRSNLSVESTPVKDWLIFTGDSDNDMLVLD